MHYIAIDTLPNIITGNLVKVKATPDGTLSLLAKAELHGGASPATLQVKGRVDGKPRVINNTKHVDNI